MKTLEILEREHEWIGWMAESLESVASAASADDVLPEEAYELLNLFETFADGRHQEKEERVLFPELLTAAGEEQRALLARLLLDHETERKHLQGMRVNVLGAVHGEPGCVRQFLHEAKDYLDLQRAHMQREQRILFPLADDLLSAEADERCKAGFEAVEGGAGDPHGLREQILGLRRRLGLPRPPAA